MQKPVRKTFDANRQSSMLFFDNGSSGEFYMRGGICFPIKYRWGRGFKTAGFAVLAGQDVNTHVVTIFEQTEWQTIDDILGSDNTIKYSGLCHWLNMIWSQYFARKLYFNQNDEVARRFRLQILRSPMIEPKPLIVEAPIASVDDYFSCVHNWLNLQQFRLQKNSPLQEQLEQSMVDEKLVLPGVMALGCCLMGIERYPWRPPVVRAPQEIVLSPL